jgi:hypothetical protein
MLVILLRSSTDSEATAPLAYSRLRCSEVEYKETNMHPRHSILAMLDAPAGLYHCVLHATWTRSPRVSASLRRARVRAHRMLGSARFMKSPPQLLGKYLYNRSYQTNKAHGRPPKRGSPRLDHLRDSERTGNHVGSDCACGGLSADLFTPGAPRGAWRVIVPAGKVSKAGCRVGLSDLYIVIAFPVSRLAQF